jgi:hypothetical protein
LSTPTKGLLLTLGGAPLDVPHTVPPLPGYYLTNVPHPVGEGCDLTLEQAEAAVEGSDVLELVDIDGEQLAHAEARHAEAHKRGRKATAEAGRERRGGAHKERVDNEADALTKKVGE